MKLIKLTKGVGMGRDIPIKYKKQYQEAMKGRSRKTAMQAFCNECVGYNNKEVKNCTDIGCPLYPFRLK